MAAESRGGQVSEHISIQDESSWLRAGRTVVSGSAFFEGSSEPLRTDELSSRIRACETVADIGDFVARLSGFFAFIHDAGDQVVAAVDHIRSIPIYYSSDGSTIADNPRAIIGEISPADFDPVLEAEYLLTGYVTGPETLVPGIRTLEAGTLLVVNKDDGQIETEQYTEYYPVRSSRTQDSTASKRQLAGVIRQAIERLCELASGRPIYVLLSGGHDSKLVLSELVNQGYSPLVALSFGRPDFSDVTLSEKVARAVGVERQYVEYEGETWNQWFQSDRRDQYLKRKHNLDSFPFHWAGPALADLERRGELPDDAVFVSGQTIGSVGEHMPSREIQSRSELIDYILENHYTLWKRNANLSDIMRTRIDTNISRLHPCEDLVAAYEWWEWRERQSKWMSQDGSLYSFWGYDWWFPLFDKEVMQVWGRLPATSRQGKDALVAISDSRFSVASDGMTAAQNTTRNYSRGERLKRAVSRSPLENIGRRVYRYYQSIRGVGSHPLGYYGMFGSGFPRKYHRLNENPHSYVVMHAVDRLSFNPPDFSGVPNDGELSLDAIESLSRVATS